MTQQIDIRRIIELRVLADVLELRHVNAVPSAVLPIPMTMGDDKTQRYIVTGSKAEIERLLEIAPAAPASADNPSTAGAMDPVAMECVKAVSIGYGERGYDGETLYCIDCQTSWADGDAHTADCLVVRARAYLAAPVAQSTAGAAKDERAAFENYFCMTLSCDGSESEELIDACRAAAFDAWMERSRRAAPALNPSEARKQALEEVAQFFEMQDGSQASKKEMGIAAKLARLLATKPAGWAQQRTEDAASKEGGADHG